MRYTDAVDTFITQIFILRFKKHCGRQVIKIIRSRGLTNAVRLCLLIDIDVLPMIP